MKCLPRRSLRGLIASLLMLSALQGPAAVPSYMNYQGRLVEGGVLVNGVRRIVFNVYTNDVSGGVVYSETNTVTVSDGLFSTALGDADQAGFAAALSYGNIYLQVNVGGVDVGGREPLASVPLAVLSRAAETLEIDGAVYGRGCDASANGGPAPIVLLGSVSNSVETTAGGSSVGGGRDNEIRDGATFSTIGGGALNRIEQGAVSSVIAGGYENVIGSTSRDTTIGGGYGHSIASNSRSSTISGGYLNAIETNALDSTIAGGVLHSIGGGARRSTISGGIDNTILPGSGRATIGGGAGNVIGPDAWSCTVGGGFVNTIGDASSDSVIAGGWRNDIAPYSFGSTIAGGVDNDIDSNAQYSTISGGVGSRIASNAVHSTIAGGGFNRVSTNAENATISGGRYHNIGADSRTAVIGGGWDNNVSSNSIDVTISGGALNDVGADARSSVIAGGYDNNIGDRSHTSVIAGGYGNTIGTNSPGSAILGTWQNNIGAGSGSSTIAGGQSCRIADSSPYSYVAGRRAIAESPGCWVWADSQDADFRSTAADQFLVRAAGGVGLGNGAPKNQLHVTDSSSGSEQDVANYVAQVENTASGVDGDVLALRVRGRHTPTRDNCFVGCFDGGQKFLGGLVGNGNGGVAIVSGGADHAECVRLVDGAEAPPAGSIVGIVKGRAVPCAREADRYMVVSDNAAVAGNWPQQDLDRYVLVSFIGQVAVRVSGTVIPGQFVISGPDGVGIGVSPESLREEHLGRLVGRVHSDTSSVNGLVNVTVGIDAAAACRYALENELGDLRARVARLEEAQ